MRASDLAAAARYAGVRVRLYDVDPETLSPDPDSVSRALDRGASAIVLVRLYGYPADIPAVTELARQYGAIVIKDGGGLRARLLRPRGDEPGGHHESIDSGLVRDLMVEAIEKRFGPTLPVQPIQWLTDNGSPYVVRDTRAFAAELNLVPLTTAINSPQSNGMAKSFVRTLKRDYVGPIGSPRCAHRHASVASRLRALQHRASALSP